MAGKKKTKKKTSASDSSSGTITPQSLQVTTQPVASPASSASAALPIAMRVPSGSSAPGFASSLGRSFPRSFKGVSSISSSAAESNALRSEYEKIREPKRPSTPLQDQAAAALIEEHLVRRDDGPNADLNESLLSSSFKNKAPYNLQGGSITNDIYEWADRNRATSPTLSQGSLSTRPRRLSLPDLQSTALRDTPDAVTVTQLREPGVFRRRFISERAEREGKNVTFLTRNFIDFLALYGFYGGDVVPEDEDDDEEDEGGEPGDEEWSNVVGVDNLNGFQQLPGIVIQRPTPIRHLHDFDSSTASNSAHPHVSERTPLIRRQSTRAITEATNVKGTSPKKAFFMLMKAFVGTGVLFLPKAFAQGGMALSVVLTIVFGWMTLHCMLLLVETNHVLGGSYGDIGEKLYGPHVRTLVLASIAVSQAGFCCAYYIFVAQNLRDLVMLTTNCQVILPDWVFIVLQVLIYVPLSWVRKIKTFSVTSLIADVFILMGLMYIFGYDMYVVGTVGPAPDILWFNMDTFPIFIGTALFAFEGICLILPIAESMKEPQHFPRVLSLCIFIIGTIFVLIGATGYLAFGSKVETVVFLNMPKGSPVVQSLQFFYVIAIVLSFPLCVYPSIRITESAIFGLADGKRSALVKWQKNLMRTVFVAVLGGVAWVGSSNLDKFVSLVGCFACIPLSFIYPSLFHFKITTNPWVKLSDLLLALFGFVALVYTTYITVSKWAGGDADIPLDRCAAAVGTVVVNDVGVNEAMEVDDEAAADDREQHLC
ncbi:neutral amino acid transporter [Podochytrium sp. JEL0797]|nr:neutral amino acid transporter [Podochytrium sp. JEL0797]